MACLFMCLKLFFKKINFFFLFQINFLLLFLDDFNILMLKINLKKYSFNIYIYFFKKNNLKYNYYYTLKHLSLLPLQIQNGVKNKF